MVHVLGTYITKVHSNEYVSLLFGMNAVLVLSAILETCDRPLLSMLFLPGQYDHTGTNVNQMRNFITQLMTL